MTLSPSPHEYFISWLTHQYSNFNPTSSSFCLSRPHVRILGAGSLIWPTSKSLFNLEQFNTRFWPWSYTSHSITQMELIGISIFVSSTSHHHHHHSHHHFVFIIISIITLSSSSSPSSLCHHHCLHHHHSHHHHLHHHFVIIIAFIIIILPLKASCQNLGSR